MTTAEEMYQLYLDAEKRILKGQVVRMGERSLTHANLADVVAQRKDWERRVAAEKNNGRGHSLATFG